MTSSLQDKRILIVEDEYYIASDLKQALTNAGAQVVGPVSDLATGLALVEAGNLDAAILDMNLDGAMSFPIADQLAQAQVPHLFLTGYDGWSIPKAYRSVPRMAKPYAAERIIDAVAMLCRT